MNQINTEQTLLILRKALNTVDYRLVEHGEMVAYVVSKMLTAEGKYSQQEIVEMSMIALLHDIGAYKTEEIDYMVKYDTFFEFEFKKTINHCIYGYLYVSTFSPLTQYADAILYHHLGFDKMKKADCKNKDLALKIFLADRLCIYLSAGKGTIDDNLFAYFKDKHFAASDIDLVINLEKQYNLHKKLREHTYLVELNGIFKQNRFTDAHNFLLLSMLMYAIDFRSEVTVIHTAATMESASQIAFFVQLDKEKTEKLALATLLHDIGKISIQVSLLEKTDSLSQAENEKIKEHVVATDHILKGSVSEEIRNIAVRHHERLDGSGYPYGLKAEDLTVEQRILAVADMLGSLLSKKSYKESFSKEKTKQILIDMMQKNYICPTITMIVLEHFDQIIDNVLKKCDQSLKDYTLLKDRYFDLLHLIPA